MNQSSVFKPAELGAALLLAVGLEAGILIALALAGGSHSLAPEKPEDKALIPIQVTPVIDDLPLLKLGSKAKAKLPDMWRKPPPKPRYEDKSAPSPLAEKNPTALPKNEVAKSDETPPPPSAELAKKVDEPIPEEAPTQETTLPEEGDNAGVKEGTEVDPLKAFVVDQYKMKVIAWFKSGFTVPSGLDCATLATLATRIAAQVGADRTVTGYTLTGPSGNEVFDARVKAHMDRKVGQQLPPPPPKYPDILDAVVLPTFSGKTSSCKDSNPSTPSPAPAPQEPVAPEGE